MMLRKVLGRIVGELEGTELHLRLQEGGAVRLNAWMLQVRHTFRRSVGPEGYEDSLE